MELLQLKLQETLLALLFADVRIDNAVLIVLVIVVKVDVVVVTVSIGRQQDVVIHPHWAWSFFLAPHAC